MSFIRAADANHAYHRLLTHLKDYGTKHTIRGSECIEVTGLSYEILDPRRRVITDRARKFPLKGALAEFLWYMTGNNKVEIIAPYLKAWPRFSDDGVTVNSNYGYQWMHPHDQILDIIKKIKKDQYTRQAVVCLYDKTYSNYYGKDNICTPTFQFFVRNNALDLIVNSRSRDLIRGECIDQFTFTLLQELVANELELNVGTYRNNIGSLHIYEDHYSLLEDRERHLSSYPLGPKSTKLIYSTFWSKIWWGLIETRANFEFEEDWISSAVAKNFSWKELEKFQSYYSEASLNKAQKNKREKEIRPDFLF